MEFTLSEAAKQAKVAKSTISRAIEKGRLSVRKDDLGRFHIDASELFRVFSPKKRDTMETQQVEPSATATGAEIEHLRAILVMTRDQIEDIKADRDHWRNQAIQLAITHVPPQKERSWWRRLVE